MTSNNLLKFLGNREYLHQVSYQELKSIVVQYPYSLSLRYLLAMKSQQEDNADLDRNIELLATYGIDRTHLQRIFSQDAIVLEDLEESIILGEDFLELKELSSLERVVDQTSFINENENIDFLVEEKNIITPIFNDIEDRPPSVVNIASTPKEIETGELTSKISTEENETTLEIEDSANQTKEEDFVILDFDGDNFEIEGKPKSSDELIPSESLGLNEIEYDENGLPSDAIEVNDFKNAKIIVEEDNIVDLFLEAEQEVNAEKAVSDSQIFITNPEEVLDIESKTAIINSIPDKIIEETKVEKKQIEVEDILMQDELSVQDIEQPDTVNNPTIIEEELAPITEISTTNEIPFEVNFSGIDPISESIDIKSTNELKEEAESTIPDSIPSSIEEKQIESEKSIHKEEIKATELQKEAFNFDSLAKFEKDLAEEKFNLPLKPVPKSGFSSWQAQNNELSPFFSINLLQLNNVKGKVLIKKKKIVHKKFEKTVAYAEESLKMDENIASETLAQLLVGQGHHEKAITMYKDLCLLLPQKSTYFAAKIEAIKNLPKEDL